MCLCFLEHMNDRPVTPEEAKRNRRALKEGFSMFWMFIFVIIIVSILYGYLKRS